MEITLSNGKDHVYQWDKDIIVTVPENVPVVYFAWGNQAVGFEVENRQVTIPPELMQVSRPIRLWTYEQDHTIDDAEIKVYPKPKPSDYVYTPTEIKTWEQLDERIAALEKGGGVAGVTSVNGKSGAVELTAEDVGAATAEDVTSAVDEAWAAAVETLQPMFDAKQDKGDYLTEVGTANINNGAVTNAKIANGAVTTGKLASKAVTAEKLYKGDYLTSGELEEATNNALAQAKASGEFDGPQGPAGADGAPGKDGANGTDGKPINWRGEYSESTQYSKLDAASYEGSSYIFSNDTPTTGAVPGIDEEWQLMAEKGDKGDTGPQGPQGEPGADAVEDLSLGLTSATVGQIAKITAVDENGVPTAWEPVDMPSGGGEKTLTLIADITLSDGDAVSFKYTGLGGLTELYFVGRLINGTINTALTAIINETKVSAKVIPVEKTEENPTWNYWCVARFNGAFWTMMTSPAHAGADAQGVYAGMLTTNSVVIGIGEAESIELYVPNPAFKPTSGWLKIWGR